MEDNEVSYKKFKRKLDDMFKTSLDDVPSCKCGSKLHPYSSQACVCRVVDETDDSGSNDKTDNLNE